MSRLLVTGANGFVGTAVRAAAVRAGHDVASAVRELRGSNETGAVHVTGEIAATTEWTTALQGVDAVIHLAARVHVMQDRSADPLAEFRAVNVEGTRRLAESCLATGVRRLVYVSSIKVNGERTTTRPFTELDTPAPEDPYGRSKHEAEQALRQLALRGGIEIVIVRPPLVYGPAVRGNLLRLLSQVRRGVPLPLGGLENRRTLIGVDNLADLLMLAATHPAAAGELFLAAEGAPLSTTALIETLAAGLGVPARLIAIPHSLLRMLAHLPGVGPSLGRLTESLEVDGRKAAQLLGWQPRLSTEAGLRAMAAWYREHAA